MENYFDLNVVQVMNITGQFSAPTLSIFDIVNKNEICFTDIDDKIINKAKEVN